MDTGDGIDRRISVEAAARYARKDTEVEQAGVHHEVEPPPVPPPHIRTSPPPRPPAPAPSREVPTLRSQPPPPPRELITLDQVRQGPRAHNDYVDSPQWAALRHLQQNKSNQVLVNAGLLHGSQANKSLQQHVPAQRAVPGVESSSRGDLVISTQPQSSALKKTSGSRVVAEEARAAGVPPCTDSIICSQCGKCRCQACTQPRELPRRWLCNNECSMQKMVDLCSCLCCVRACFYHCFKDAEGDECFASDDPCACCERPHCCKRWTCLGLLSLCLPCLCLYWPLRCGLDVCTSVYNRCSRRGCHCRRDRLPGSKRLLIDSESSST